MLVWTKAEVQTSAGDILVAEACKPLSTLTRTQRNFLLTLQSNAHRAVKEDTCPLCNEVGGIEHAIWTCECRTRATVRDEPANAGNWPSNFR
eukprot:1218471-Amphidinium_carterae.1